MNATVAVETELDPSGDPLPRVRDAGLRWLLVLTLVLQLWAWSRLEGYQLADSVEYMDRAHAAATGAELQGRQAVRSFAFSLVFLPMFALADWIGLEDLRPLVYVGRWIQMAFGLALVGATVRLGARLGGRATGWAAGALIALNPVFLRYSVSPVAGIAAALFVALGIERTLWSTGRRSALIGGLWLGAAVLCSYKSLLVVFVLLGWTVLRDRWKGRVGWLGLGGGVLVACGVQALLDRLVYGRWGGSLFGWFMNNVFSRIVDWSWRVHEATSGALSAKARALALWFYERQNAFMGYYLDSSHLERRQRRGGEWYFENLTEMLVWPVIVLVALGLLRTIRRPRTRGFACALVVVAFVIVTSTKGDKSFRLWLPILPLIAVLGATGFGLVRGPQRAMPIRRPLAWLLVALSLPLGMRSFVAANPHEHGSYWRAVDWLNRRATTEGGGEPVQLGAAYHWAVFLRAAPGVELRKSPYSLLSWSEPPDAPGDETADERRRAIRAYLASLDALIVHLPLLASRPGLMDTINDRFGVEAVFYEQDRNAGIGPVYVLTRREPDGGGRRFFTLSADAEAPAFRSERGFDRPVAFGTTHGGRDERLTLLGWEIEPLPGDGLYWLTYHWRSETGLSRDWRIIDRATAPDAHNSFQNNHWPAYGVLPTSTWKPGWIVSESFAFLPSGRPFAIDSGYLPLGGPYRRGDLLPLSLWIGVFVEDDEGAIVERMEPLGAPGSPIGGPGRLGSDPYRRWLRHGHLWSKDDLFEVGRFFLPVEDRARVPDDGRPLTYAGAGSRSP